MAARRQGIADLAGDGRLRHPVQRLLVLAVSGSPASIRRPGDRHCRLAGEKGGEIFDEAPLLDARRHELVLVAHVGEDLHTDIAVDRRLHGVGIEELAALVAEALLEHELGVGRLAEEGGAIHAGLIFVGEELADLVEFLPGLGRRQLVIELGLEFLLVLAGRPRCPCGSRTRRRRHRRGSRRSCRSPSSGCRDRSARSSAARRYSHICRHRGRGARAPRPARDPASRRE